jgi:hypothetical protein
MSNWYANYKFIVRAVLASWSSINYAMLVRLNIKDSFPLTTTRYRKCTHTRIEGAFDIHKRCNQL